MTALKQWSRERKNWWVVQLQPKQLLQPSKLPLLSKVLKQLHQLDLSKLVHIWRSQKTSPDSLNSQLVPNLCCVNTWKKMFTKSIKERRIRVEFHSSKWFFQGLKMLTQASEFMLVATSLITNSLMVFLMRSSKIIMDMENKTSILATWITKNLNVHLSLKKRLLESFQQELELVGTWLMSHLAQVSPKSREIRLRKLFLGFCKS